MKLLKIIAVVALHIQALRVQKWSDSDKIDGNMIWQPDLEEDDYVLEGEQTPEKLEEQNRLMDKRVTMVRKWLNQDTVNLVKPVSTNILVAPNPPTHVNSKPVHWLHIHNCAGSWMRFAAALSGEVPLSPHTANWNHHATQSCHTGADCHHKKGLMAQQGATWTAVERGVNASTEICPDEFIHGIALSEPIHYLQTEAHHSHFSRGQLDAMFDYVMGKTDKVAGLKLAQSIKESCFASQNPKWHPYYDNFFVRVLLGYDVLFSPPGSITMAHAEQAKEILKKFDIVIIVPELMEHLPQMKKHLGWNIEELSKMRQRNHRSGKVFDFTDAQLADLTKLNQPALELFKFAKELAWEKTKAAAM